jgi:hypothetical protein
MQLAYRHDERPGESYMALDGKKGSGSVSFVVSLLFPVAKRKSGGSSCSLSFRFCLFVVSCGFALKQETTVFLDEFLLRLTCLYQFQDRALATSAIPEGKKSTITVELTIKVKTKFTSSNAEKGPVLDLRAKETCVQKVRKWTRLKSKVVPPGGSSFGPFLIPSLLRRSFQVEADLTSNSCFFLCSAWFSEHHAPAAATGTTSMHRDLRARQTWISGPGYPAQGCQTRKHACNARTGTSMVWCENLTSDESIWSFLHWKK